MEHRIERDSLGEVKVPADSYWGATTQRSVDNFQISGLQMPRQFIRGLGVVKMACAEANLELGALSPDLAKAVIKASREVIEGRLDTQFPVDVFQTGSGTHSNMNANEVIANRAAEMLGFERGSKKVHPNDHVNASQSSNDVIPTAMHIALVESLDQTLLPALENLRASLQSKADEFKGILKTGRTHLMDATPVSLGMEFAAYRAQVGNGIDRVRSTYPRLLQLAIGGTAVGTGVNAPKGFSKLVVEKINGITGIDFRENPLKSEGIAAHDAVVELSGTLKTLALGLTKIANDIRWMASGPKAGLGEVTIPANEPGSSIMPGKVNPTQAEALLMACAQVIGNDLTITIAGATGSFELNVMKPLMAYNILQSIAILSNSVRSFTDKCVRGIRANEKHIQQVLEQNLMIVTGLVPKIGYDKAAEIAKEALASNRSLREVALERTGLPPKVIDKLLDPKKML